MVIYSEVQSRSQIVNTNNTDMGLRKNFPRVGKVNILVVHFRLLTIQMQIDVHITLCPFYTTKEMTHVTAAVPKMRFVGSNVSFHTV